MLVRKTKVKLIKRFDGDAIDVLQSRKITRLKDLPIKFVRTGWISSVVR